MNKTSTNITPKERQRIAIALRSRADDNKYALFADVGMATGWPVELMEPGEICARLADLIDPTCEIVRVESDSDYTTAPHYKCSRCGYDLDIGEWDAADDYRITSYAPFCSHCGARVVTDDEQGS